MNNRRLRQPTIGSMTTRVSQQRTLQCPWLIKSRSKTKYKTCTKTWVVSESFKSLWWWRFCLEPTPRICGSTSLATSSRHLTPMYAHMQVKITSLRARKRIYAQETQPSLRGKLIRTLQRLSRTGNSSWIWRVWNNGKFQHLVLGFSSAGAPLYSGCLLLVINTGASTSFGSVFLSTWFAQVLCCLLRAWLWWAPQSS